MAYTLENLQTQNTRDLPLYPFRVHPEPFVATDYIDIEQWCDAHKIFVHIPQHSYYFYFKSEQDAAFFMLGYRNEKTR